MNLKRTSAIFLRQIFLIKSNPTRLLALYMWVILDIFQWGFISKYLSSFGGATLNFATVLLGAIIMWEFMSRMQNNMMVVFLEDVWSNNFVNFFASPLKISEYVTGLSLFSIISSLIGMLGMILIAGLFFGYNILMIGLFILPCLLILYMLGLALGILSSAIVFRLGPSAEWLGWPIPMLMSIFVGVFYPISVLPTAIQWISKLIPASYVFESLRAFMASHSFTGDIAINLIIGGALAIVYLLLAYMFFMKIYRRNLKNGSLARFSAEV